MSGLVRHASSATLEIKGPPGSGAFGVVVTVLPNGNFVVTDPAYDASPTLTDVGAVSLFSASGRLLSRLTGSHPSSGVGNGGIRVLPNGNYLVLSPSWRDGPGPNMGAVTWCDAASGVSGVISAENSLIGSTQGDSVGNGGLRILANGNYLILSPNWTMEDGLNTVGALTWCPGAGGRSGRVSAANSLIGTFPEHFSNQSTLVDLPNGNYVMVCPHWPNGAQGRAGAVTWGNGQTGTVGQVSAANSLLGTRAEDKVGSAGLVVNAAGNFLVCSPDWSNGAAAYAGAVTWVNGATGLAGPVSAANSLVGSTLQDQVGARPTHFVFPDRVQVVKNGNFLVVSPNWSNKSVRRAGAATWIDGSVGLTGVIAATNSLVGSRADGAVGQPGATVLTNGNYVVCSGSWNDSGAERAGAATWGDGGVGVRGVVGRSNSLYGQSSGDAVGNDGVLALTNGNYVVRSTSWRRLGQSVPVGAVTWCSGTTGRIGAVTPTNSLIGSSSEASVAHAPLVALPNGHYVVRSQLWTTEGKQSRGAVTWGDGVKGTVGVVSPANSLVGASAYDSLGLDDVHVLANSSYVLTTRYFDHEGVDNVGAVAWCRGDGPTTGQISVTNSLVGNAAVGGFYGPTVTVLKNGHYMVHFAQTSNGAATLAGSLTWGDGSRGVTGVVSALNSLLGASYYDVFGDQKLIELPNGNCVMTCPQWDDGASADVGAVVWIDGAAGTRGTVSSENALIGAQAGDKAGSGGVLVLSTGDYVVLSDKWLTGAYGSAGAATWASGTGATRGRITPENSLVGTPAPMEFGGLSAADTAGGFVAVYPDGNYLISASYFRTDPLRNRGSATLGRGRPEDPRTVGAANRQNGLVFETNLLFGYASMTYDAPRHRLFVGVPGESVVFVFSYDPASLPGAVEDVVLAPQPDGGLHLSARAAAGSRFRLDRSDDLIGWVRVGELTVDPAGLLEYLQVPGGGPDGYFRLEPW